MGAGDVAQAILREAIGILRAENITGAPVVQGGKVVGVVSISDILDFEVDTPALPSERPSQVEWGGFEEEPVDEEDTASFYSDMWDDVGVEVAERFASDTGPEWDLLSEHVVAQVMTREIIALLRDPSPWPHREVGRELRRPEDHGRRREGISGPAIHGTHGRRRLFVLAQDLITRAPVIVPVRSRLSEAARQMRDADVGSIVVMHEGKPVGILTDRDLALFLAGEVEDALIEDIMTPNPASIPAMADVEVCLERLEEEGVRRILIVEDGSLVGVVSLDDIVMHLAYLLGKASSLIRKEVSGARSMTF